MTAGIATTPAQADEWNKKTILTVHETVQVTDTVLEPGRYVLKLLDSQSNRHIVQIFNSDQTHIIDTVLAIPAQRLQPTGNTAFSYWETPPGTARALRTWYYPGDNLGQEFPYPKHLQQVAMLTSSTPAPPAAAPVEAKAAPAESPAQPESVQTPEPAPQQQPAEIAQNTAPAPADPAFGLAGALLLGLAGLLRLRRQA